MSKRKTTWAGFFQSTPTRRRRPAPALRRFEQLESRIVFSGGLDQVGPAALPDPAVPHLTAGASAMAVAFPDVCFTPPESSADFGATPPAAPETEHSSVVVIHHPDGTIEWIYDLPSLKGEKTGRSLGR